MRRFAGDRAVFPGGTRFQEAPPLLVPRRVRGGVRQEHEASGGSMDG